MLIILGAPGSGKGTQGRMLSEFLGKNFLSAGDSLKKEIEQNSKLMEKINKGIIIDGIEVNSLIVNKLKTLKKGDIFEGFPRNIYQAEYLLNNFDLTLISGLVVLNVDRETIMNRLDKRYICSSCHTPYLSCNICCNRETIRRIDDQNINAISQRINNFHNSVEEIKEFFTKQNITLGEIDGTQDIEKVRDNILLFYKNLLI